MNTPKKLLTWLTVTMAVIGLTSQLAARDLYWSEYGGEAGTAVIKAADIDGSNETLIFEGTEMASFIVDIAVTDDHIYWTGHSGGDVWRANRDGSEAGRIITSADIDPIAGIGLENPHNITVDTAAGKLHIACFVRGIFSADLDGSNLTRILHDPFYTQYSAVAVRSPEEVLFLTTNTSTLFYFDPTAEWQTLFQLSLEGGAATYGLAYDSATNAAYYSVWGGAGALGSLYRYDFNTSQATLLRSDILAPLGLKLSPDSSHLLVAQRGIGVGAVRVSDGGYQLIAPASAAHFGVAVSANPELDDPTFPPPPAEDGDVIFLADFDSEADQPGLPPATLVEGGQWTSLSGPTEGSITVETDSGNSFGFGEENRFLRVSSARQKDLLGNFPGSPIVTLSFDYIGRVNQGDGNRWLNVDLRQGGTRAHITSIRIPALTVRPDNVPSGDNDTPLRFDTVFNNSFETITYDRPDGEGTAELAPHNASLWVFNYATDEWSQLYAEYNYVRAINMGEDIDNVLFQFDSNAPLRSYDLDNVMVIKGAHVGAFPRESDVEPPPPPPFLGFVDTGFSELPPDTTLPVAINPSNSSDFLGDDWTSIGFHSQYMNITPDQLLIAEDSGNLFGKGTDNPVLRSDGAVGWALNAANNFGEEILTLRFDMAARGFVDTIGVNRLTTRFLTGDGSVTADNTAILLRLEIDADGGILANSGHRFNFDEAIQFEAVVNNSEETITYDSPLGLKILPSGSSDVWANGELVAANSTFGRNANVPTGPIQSFVMQTFSNNPWTADFDLIRISPGVDLAPFAPPDISPYRLQTVWTLAPGDRDYLTDDSRQRGLGYNPVSGHLMVPDRHDTIAILDGATGAHVGTLSNTGIDGGTFFLNHIVVAEDGAIYGANLTTNASTNPLKVYRWASEAADPVLVYEGHPNEGAPSHDDPALDGYELRFGDTMAVRGSGMDTQILMAPRFGVYLTILTPEGSMETFVDNRLITDITTSPAGWLTHGLAFGPGDTFYGKRQPQFGSATAERALLHVAFDLEEGTGTVIGTYGPGVFPNEIGPIGIDVERMLLVGLDSDAEDTNWPRRPAEVSLYDLSALSPFIANQALDSKTFGGFNWNGNGAGQVVFGQNDMVYVLDTNNGIAAFRIVDEDAPPTGFAAWAAANFPGVTDEAIIGPSADPSGNGVPNLIKYVLAMDPNSASLEGLPVQGTTAEDDKEYLTLTFATADAADDAEWEVLVSGSVEGDWTAGAVEVSRTPNGDGTTTWVFRDSVAISEAGGGRRFMLFSATLD